MNQQSSVSIGILCNPLWQSQQKTLRDNSEMANWKKILETASSLGVKAYIFGLNDLQFEKNMLRAYSWDGIRFTEEQIPMPHVIYDQLASRKLERSQRLRDRRKRLSEMYGLRIFNDGFFDKWQVYEWLSENQAIRSALPATILHRQRDRTKQFMERHGSVYIKPIHGSLGIGIIRLLQTADGTVQYQWKSGRKKVVQGQMASFDKWLEQFGKRLRQRPYICQESIRLATYEGRPFDIRILMQRDGSGQWKRTKAFARVARIGDFTSNLSSGGLALPLSQVLSQIWKEHRQYNQVRQRINDLARKVVQQLQEECEHTLGELGVDVGVTPSGQVYVIEVNSKPHKTPTTQAGRQDLVDLSFRRPIEFAVYLAQTHLGSKAGGVLMLYIFAKPTQGIRRLLERTRAQLYGKETVLRADDIVLRFGQSKLADPTEGLILNRQSALQLSRSKSQMAKFLRQVGVRFVLPSQNQPSANRFVRQFRIPVFNHQPLACFRTDGKEPWTNGRIQGMPQHEEEVALDSDRLITRAGWLAVRAVHALGLDAAYVSLGLGPKGVLHVIDVTSNPQLEGRLLEIYSEAIQTYMEQQITLSRFNYNQLKLGTDVELMLENAEGKMVLASRYFTRKGRVGCDDRSVQQDGRRLPLLELRPDPDQSPMGLYVNLRTTMLEAARRINRQDVAWRGGSMPFAGYSTGGHIHFSGFPFSSRLVRALDAYLGLPLMAVENPTRALGRRPRYGFLGDVRHKSYGGFEYRTPASFIVDPKVTLAAFALAHLIAVHYIELPEIWLYDPQVQSHFYSHEINELHPYLEQCMVAIRRLPAYRRYEEQIEPLFHMIEQQEIWDETVDVRDVWEIPKRFANTSSVPAVKRRRRKRVQSS